MHVVENGVDSRTHGAGFVIARILATSRADAAHRSAHGRAGAAQIEAQLIKFVERGLDMLGVGALEHDVAGLSVQSDQARSMLFPDIAQLAQNVGVIVHAGGRHDAQRVEFTAIGELIRNFREAGNDAAAIAEHSDHSAFPVTLAGLVRQFELSQQILHHVGIVLVLGQREALQSGNEARPRAALQLIEVRSNRHRLGHNHVSLVVNAPHPVAV